jgi:8-oxo-dGTP pyrophosphatase MutT (NUDIX family)
MQLTRLQRIRTRAFLFATAIIKRMTLGTRAMLIDGSKIYLIRHTYMPGWHMPGGGIEPGETAEDSMAREVLEETGYRLTARPEFFGFYHNAGPATNRDHVALYLSRDFTRDRVFKKNWEIAEFGWFEIDAVPNGTTEGTKRRIAEVFGGNRPDPTW